MDSLSYRRTKEDLSTKTSLSLSGLTLKHDRGNDVTVIPTP